MKKKLLNILPFILTSLLVIGFWKLKTSTDNYAWNPAGKEILMLDIALTSIFLYKTLFWLIIANLIVFSIKQFIRKNFITVGLICIFTITSYFLAGQYIDNKCAFHYYSVFHNQSVAEGYIESPIIEAGYHIGPILTEKIINKDMKYRRYAIGGIEKIKFKPATQTLRQILFDKSEFDVFRADAYQALNSFNTDETEKILSEFRTHVGDSLDKKVIELGDYFIKNQ